MSSARSVEPGVSLLTAGEIRVAVLPVGPVPRDVLDDYLELINKYHHVSLSATRSFYRESPAAAGGTGGGVGKTPFAFMDWSNSYLHLRFLQSEDARRRTRLPDLHPGRQVLALLGIVYGPMCASVQGAYEEFKKLCRSYSEAFVVRCFVFEPSEEHIRQERECAQLPDLVMFPPGFGGGPSHIEQHLEVWMHDLAAALLTEFEKWMLAAAPALMKLNGFADSAEFTGASAVLDEVAKRLAGADGEVREKQRWGRLMKMKGDMCLLAGSPRDAAEHFRTGQEIAKACGDWVWYGAALEGMAAARVAEVLNGGAPGPAPGSSGDGSGAPGGAGRPRSFSVSGPARSRDGRGPTGGFMTPAKWELLRRSDAESLVRECFTDARGAYRRKGGVASLMAEQHLKLARLAAGLRGLGARREVAELAQAVLDLCPALPCLEDRIAATVECAQVLGLVGAARKRQLLLWAALEAGRGGGAGAPGGPGAALLAPAALPPPLLDRSELLRIALRALEAPDEAMNQDPDDQPRLSWWQRRGPGGPGPGGARGWDAVALCLLEAALVAARQAHAPAEAWELAATLLREYSAALSPQQQAALLDTLAQASAALPSRFRTRPGLGPGPLVSLRRLLPAALPLQPTPLAVTPAGAIAVAGAGGGRGRGGGGGGGGGGLFIFNPYAAKRQAKLEAGEAAASTPDWSCNDEGRVEVLLTNSLALPIKIDQLQLSVRFLGGPGGGDAAAAAAGGKAGPGPGPAGTTAGPGPGAAGGVGSVAAGHTGGGGSGSVSMSGSGSASGSGSGRQPQAFKTPALSLVLPPAGRPQRVVLCGKPQLPGTYLVEGCMITAWGVTWAAPFATAIRKTAAGPGGAKRGSTSGAASANPSSAASGAGAKAAGAVPPAGTPAAAAASAAAGAVVGMAGRLGPGWAPAVPACVNVLPALPLIKAIVRASPVGGPLPAAPSPSGAATSTSASGSLPGTPAPGGGAHALPHALPPSAHPHAPHHGHHPTALPASVTGPGSAAALGLPHGHSGPTPGLGPGGASADPTVVAVSPTNDDIHAPMGQPASEDLGRSPPVPLLEGQRLAWSLTLVNAGPLPVTGLSVAVTNHKGAPLKPLRGAPLPASFQGVHAEIDDSALTAAAAAAATPSTGGGAAATEPDGRRVSNGGGGGGGALPLRPGGSLTLPLALAVGQAPRGAFREAAIEITVSYLTKPADPPAPSPSTTPTPADPPSSASSSALPTASSATPTTLVGRRMTLALSFDVTPSLALAGAAFLDHTAPTRGNTRLPPDLDPPLDPRLLACSGPSPAPSLGGTGAHGPLGLGLQGPGQGGNGAYGAYGHHEEWPGDAESSRGPSMDWGHGQGSQFNLQRLRLGSHTSVTGGPGPGPGPGFSLGPGGAPLGPHDSPGPRPRLSAGSWTLPQAPGFAPGSYPGPGGLPGPGLGLGPHGPGERTGGPGPSGPSGSSQHNPLLGGPGGLSARLAGLDLSMGPGTAGGAGGGGGKGARGTGSLLGLSTRPGPGAGPSHFAAAAHPHDLLMHCGSLTHEGSVMSASDLMAASPLPSPGMSMGLGLGAGAGGSGPPPPWAASSGPSRLAPSVEPRGPEDPLGLVTDCVLCVTVRNASNAYFRAWLARLDDAGGGPPPLTAAAASAADIPVEVLQPGDTARLAAPLPSVAAAAVAALREEQAAAAVAGAGGGGGGGRFSEGGDEPSPLRQLSNSRLRAASIGGTSLRRMHTLSVTIPAAAAVAAAAAAADASAGGAGGGGSDGGGGELAEEADRMAAAEALAEGWAVGWELVTGLSEAAAGRAPPRGMVRLAAVDIARSMSTTAVHALHPSTLHCQFQALPPACPGAAATPRLEDLTARLHALGLMPPSLAGSVWGLHVSLGDLLRMQLLLHNRGTHPHTLRVSIAASHAGSPSAASYHLSTAYGPQGDHPSGPAGPGHRTLAHQHSHSQHGPGVYGGYGAIVAAGLAGTAGHHGGGGLSVGVYGGSASVHGMPHQMYGAHAAPASAYGGSVSNVRHGPSRAHPHGPGRAHHGPHAVDSVYGGGGWAGHAHASTADGTGLPASGGGLVGGTPAAACVLVGCCTGFTVTAGARSTASHPFGITCTAPGLYVLAAAEVAVVPEGADAALGSGGPAGPQRVYASCDRMLVLCT